MSHNLELAQEHAWNLARTLITTVILFRFADEYGVIPEIELYDAEVGAHYVCDPYCGGHSVH
ncbi:hypothetical protein ACFOEZ_00900 [Tianweitania populi]|uniref:Uncharacterized protein n=1 Tax=Tianweitania populi TaxID=1607949 RepID=A0A8J3GMV7_9HYPH|nr:hypothetical protein [Tianweitania populi]GHD21668.1 hypothetical protein GCM10016234_35210 [Tianweitania populi]